MNLTIGQLLVILRFMYIQYYILSKIVLLLPLSIQILYFHPVHLRHFWARKVIYGLWTLSIVCYLQLRCSFHLRLCCKKKMKKKVCYFVSTPNFCENFVVISSSLEYLTKKYSCQDDFYRIFLKKHTLGVPIRQISRAVVVIDQDRSL